MMIGAAMCSAGLSSWGLAVWLFICWMRSERGKDNFGVSKTALAISNLTAWRDLFNISENGTEGQSRCLKSLPLLSRRLQQQFCSSEFAIHTANRWNTQSNTPWLKEWPLTFPKSYWLPGWWELTSGYKGESFLSSSEVTCFGVISLPAFGPFGAISRWMSNSSTFLGS